MRFSRILVATDFSEVADHAVPWAFEMAQQYGAKLTLCHVMEALRPPNPLYASAYPREIFRPDVHREVEEAARTQLRRRVPATHAQVAVDLAVSHGDAADEIVRHAEERACDLIILATGGRRRRKHVLLGSVAEKVIRRARCAVLIVR